MEIEKIETTTTYNIELKDTELSTIESALAIADGEIPGSNAQFGELRKQIEVATQ